MIPDRIEFLADSISQHDRKKSVASRPLEMPGESTVTKGLLLYQVSKITSGERGGDEFTRNAG